MDPIGSMTALPLAWADVPDRLRARGLRWTPQRRLLLEVLEGTRGAAGVEVELDRRTAIARVLSLTGEGDGLVG